MIIRSLFWNIENYQGADMQRAEFVEKHIRTTNPEVLGFSEIKDKAALRSMLQERLHDYDFGITDGKQGIELLAGWKRGIFDQTLFTQRREFKSNNEHLRPGSLLSVKKDGKFFNFLFLHTDSGRKDKDYNNRQDMFERIWSLKARLDDVDGGDSHFVVEGDLNTMGKKARGGAPEITGMQEIENLAEDASKAGMKLLRKTHDETWARVNSNGNITLSSDLDHIIVSDNLRVHDGNTALVRGWVDATSNEERLNFVEEVSDHCSVECSISPI